MHFTLTSLHQPLALLTGNENTTSNLSMLENYTDNSTEFHYIVNKYITKFSKYAIIDKILGGD